ncbi:hypothetical protein OHAE_3015 [Ochrobactrum soli]|uniref:Uncharacterized protein n=1 Tax=Ochrobactrum soli TaxID=2448455 RepID=A0A2P9HG50_9HYPH|nr:hypothetical protein OHAE_3015 [[Ochrobactrum] soli]
MHSIVPFYFSGRERWCARRSHKPDMIGSIPMPATNYDSHGKSQAAR